MQVVVARGGGLLIHTSNFTIHMRIRSFELCCDNLLCFVRIPLFLFFSFFLSFVLIHAMIPL